MAIEIAKVQQALGTNFTLREEIGRGGMAVVFLADDHRHGRKVAIKVLKEELLGSAHAERFLREIKLEGQLQHSNILPIFDSGANHGLLYFIMPFVEGRTLRTRLDREGMLPVEEALALGKEIAQALDHAHGMDVIHRDIKPANILLRDGQALVADFGVAKAVEESAGTALTQTGIVVGTPAYMSPEQAGGQTRLDPRSDLYSLGCVLYEMLGGEPPFTGPTTQSVLAKHLNEPPPSLATVRPDLPPGLVALVRVLLSKVPADRPATATEVIRLLEDPKTLTQGPPPPLLHRFLPWTWARRTVLAAGLLGVAVFLESIFDFWPPTTQWDLDPNKVVVFPLGDRGGGGLNGATASLAILMALENAAPLRPLDAWNRLSPAQRSDIDILPAEEARRIALAAGAGHYLTGAITRQQDSLGVSLTLFETGPDTVVDRESLWGALPDGAPNQFDINPEAFQLLTDEVISQVGINATIGLVPDLIDPGRDFDMPELTDRIPEAVVHWMYGEREYRLSRFEEALEFYETAVETDPLLALAALKGAQAASWIKDWDRAEALLEAVLPNLSLLPPRYEEFAKGLYHFTQMRPDSASSSLRAAIAEDSEWAEAWMALGEVYHHLFPADLGADSTDIDFFTKAAELDPWFHIPLIHLAEDALRRGRVVEASQFLRTLEEGGAYPSTLGRLQMMFECVDQGATRIDWQTLAANDIGTVFDAGFQLAIGGYQAACAKAAFRAVLGTPGVPRNVEWGAIMGLQGLLVAEGRHQEALTLLDDARSKRYGEADYFIIIGVLAGAPWTDRAQSIVEVVQGRYPDEYRGLNRDALWVMGAWHAHQENQHSLQAVVARLRERAAQGDRVSNGFARAMGAQLTLLAGDTTSAIEELRAVLPQGNRVDLGWRVPASLPLRYLTLAEVLLDRGSFSEALSIASVFDHPEPIVFLPFSTKSLQVRLEAARAVGNSSIAEEMSERLRGLGRTDSGS